MHKRQWIVLAVALTAMAGTSVNVMSHGKAKGIVLERHTVMSEIGDAVKTIRAMIRGKQSLNRETLALNAAVIAREAEKIVNLFPDTKASRKGPGNNAKAKIWDHKERFDAITWDVVSAADKMAKIAATSTPKELKAQFLEIGRTCKSCHKDYRKKKKNKH